MSVVRNNPIWLLFTLMRCAPCRTTWSVTGVRGDWQLWRPGDVSSALHRVASRQPVCPQCGFDLCIEGCAAQTNDGALLRLKNHEAIAEWN